MRQSGHTATDKQCLEFIRARDARKKTVAGQGQTYSRALTGDTNTIASATARPPNAAAVNLDEQRLELKSTISEFTEQFTSDITCIITEYGNEIHQLKIAHTNQMEIQNQKITKIEKKTDHEGYHCAVYYLSREYLSTLISAAKVCLGLFEDKKVSEDMKSSLSLQRVTVALHNAKAYLEKYLDQTSLLSERHWTDFEFKKARAATASTDAAAAAKTEAEAESKRKIEVFIYLFIY